MLDEWQKRCEETPKGDWTRKMIPDIRRRYKLPLTMDHYTTQMLTGHGDFKVKFHQFKLVDRFECDCGDGSETVQHVLLRCRRVDDERAVLKKAMEKEQEEWPPEDGAFLKSRYTYEALRKFSRSLKNRTDK